MSVVISGDRLKLIRDVCLMMVVLLSGTACDETPGQSSATAIHTNAITAESNHLLLSLGLKRLPRVDKSNVEIPPTMIKLYENKILEGFVGLPSPRSRNIYSNTARIYLHQGTQEPFDVFMTKWALMFDVDPLPENERLSAAELRLTPIQYPQGGGWEKLQVLVYDLVQPGVQNVSDSVFRLLDSRYVDLQDDADEVLLDVTPAVEKWYMYDGTWLSELYGDHVLLIETQLIDDRRNHKEWIPDAFQWRGSERAALVVYSDDGQKSRRTSERKRNVSARVTSSGKGKRDVPEKYEHCHKAPLYVSFQEIGWDRWVIGPLGYDSNYCDGFCLFPDDVSGHSTYHAFLQSLQSFAVYVPKPCCVPTKLSPTSMLYVDEKEKLVLKYMENMQVDVCGCR